MGHSDSIAHAERLKTLWQLATRRGLDEVARFHAMLRLASDALGMDLAVLVSFNDEYTAHYAHHTLGVLPEGPLIPSGDVICRRIHTMREPVFVADLVAHPEYRGHRLVDEAGLRAYVGVPVWAGEEVEGGLIFLRRQPMPALWSEADIAYMELVAGWLGYHLAQVRQQEEMERHALTDALTGLLNRRAAEVRLDEELARARRHNEGYALALLDLDNFKAVNDRYGHAVGDEALRAVARRIEAGLREDDWVARWGGEEFLVFLRNADLHESVFVLERLAAQVKASPIATSAGEIRLTLSAGIGLPSGEDRTFRDAVELADTCLYRAKANGRDRIEVQDGGAVLWPAQIIKRALRDERVVMATQVIVDLETGNAVADEALARVILPDGRLLPAGDFIEAAEGLGLMAEIDRLICRAAMARCVSKVDGGIVGPDFAHFVNLSPQFLARRDLVEELLVNAMNYCKTCCIEFGPIKPLVFEITERQFLHNLSTLEADLKPLLDFGFRLALDDFGSGYSSFLYLARLPISFLKIEGWMVANMRKERKIRAIVESLARFAREEGIITVAECIEDAESAHMLREMGVNLGQGWHFGRPQVEAY
jgi:diguanylate cyclase (GGDEF)-like protein